MAVIARKYKIAAALAVILMISPGLTRADEAANVRAKLGQIANALTTKSPADAMSPFSKSYANYSKLRDDFVALTNTYGIANEVDVVDEQDSENEVTATVRWAITLNDTGNGNQRSAEIHVRLAREKNKWKIVDFSPIDIFDPSGSTTPTEPK